MLRAIVLAAVLAGTGAGLVLSLVQTVAVVPTIVAAEAYENSGIASAAHGHTHGQADGADHHDAGAWAPGDGIERNAWTAVSNVAFGIGFALLLCAAFALHGRVNTRAGILWGLGGFVAFFVNPAFGLPPEIPGTYAAALEARQLWFAFAVVCSIAGLALVGLGTHWQSALAGTVLLALPHVVGAPHPEIVGGSAPAALGQAFVSATYLANGAFWVVLGLLGALAYQRFAERDG